MAATDTKKTTKKSDRKIELKVPKVSYYGTGKRKSAIAKVWIFEGKGKISINNLTPESYLKQDILTQNVMAPLKKVGLDGKYDIKASVLGGGIIGQSDAIRLGVARALLQVNEEFRSTLREDGFLTRDPRVKERKKYGRKKARKAFQFRKR